MAAEKINDAAGQLVARVGSVSDITGSRRR